MAMTKRTWRTSAARSHGLSPSCINQLRDSPLDVGAPKVLTSDWRKVRRTQRAREIGDPPTRRFKVACALYATGHGGPIKVLADSASIGKSTLRKYLEHVSHIYNFCVSVYCTWSLVITIKQWFGL